MAMFVSGSSISTGSFGSVHTAGKVGIGTASPNAKLTVIGDFLVGAATNTPIISASIAGRVVAMGDVGNSENNTQFVIDDRNTKIYTPTTDTKFGIGTSVPSKMLTVKGDISASGDFLGSSTSTGSFAQLRLNVSNLSNSGSEVATVDGTQGRLFTVSDEMSGSIFSANTIAGLPVIEAFSDNKVNLGPFSSPIQIDGSGNISGSSTSILTMSEISSSGDIVAEGDVVAYYTSDLRLKDNVEVIQGSLDKIDDIRGVEFDWNEQSPGWARERGHDIGVIAQEVQKVIPEIVVERKNGYLGVDYKRLVPLLIESVKELRREVNDLKKKVV